MAQAFRPNSTRMELACQGLCAVLCNDKPETFGAPDVLHVRSLVLLP